MLSVETRGGECPNGPCSSLITIGPDGAVHQVLPADEDLGTIPKAELDALTAEIERANFPLIESRPFTGPVPDVVRRSGDDLHVPPADRRRGDRVVHGGDRSQPPALPGGRRCVPNLHDRRLIALQ
jgi:hypothetical protein